MMETKEAKDSREKKRRRTIKTQNQTESRSSSPDSNKKLRGESKQSAKTLFYQEEAEVLDRDAQEDQALHQAAAEELRRVMQEIHENKLKSTPEATEKNERLRIHGMMQFITLKKLNRLSHFRCKKVREATSQEKTKIDQKHLILQNLLYEVMHLQKEVNKCLEFKSKDEDVSLVPVDEFFSEAPEHISRPDVTQNDEHQLTLARLDWELEQRKRLSEKLAVSGKEKEDLSKIIRMKKEQLESLQPKLATILQATRPVQDYLGMPFDEVREQHRSATYLPRPLYVLYMQATAYRDACDKLLSVTIDGDVDVARATGTATPEVEEDSGSEGEDQEKQSGHRRRTQSDDRVEVKRKRLLRKHPLSVNLNVRSKDDNVLSLTFYYLVAMEIVTVTVQLTPGLNIIIGNISGGDLLASDTLLSCLYPYDVGEDTPNTSNNYALQRMGMEGFGHYVEEVGRPYLWAQWLCGLRFLQQTADKPGSRADESLSASYMEATIIKLRSRIRARLALQKQLFALERCNIEVDSEHQHLFPAKLSSRLTQWKRITHSDYTILPHTQPIINSKLALPSDLYFLGLAERGSAKLFIHTVIGADYPASAPVFSINLHWNSERTCLNDPHIRDMEAEVNVHYPELVMNSRGDDQLLTAQIHRILMCLDIYLETEATDTVREGPVEFVREKIIPRAARGPLRSKPYRYNPQLSFFTHR